MNAYPFYFASFRFDFLNGDSELTPRGIDEACYFELHRDRLGYKPDYQATLSMSDEELADQIDWLGSLTGCDDDFRTDPEDAEFYREMNEYSKDDESLLAELEAPLTQLELLELELAS